MTEPDAIIEIEVREADIEAVFREYEAENPGKKALQMPPAEFADRMIKKVRATARLSAE